MEAGEKEKKGGAIRTDPARVRTWRRNNQGSGAEIRGTPSHGAGGDRERGATGEEEAGARTAAVRPGHGVHRWHSGSRPQGAAQAAAQDRKSTRLNSSHRCISYAVFCLK